jgi:hypothetical protein
VAGRSTVSQTIPKPSNGATSTTTSFTNLPVGTVVVECKAFADPVNGVAPLLALAITSVDLQPGTGNVVYLDLVSTIDHLSVTAKGLTAGTLQLYPNQTVPLTVTAYISATSIAPIGPGNLVYTMTGTGFQIVQTGDSASVVSSGAGGTGTVTVTEAESGKSFTFNVKANV